VIEDSKRVQIVAWGPLKLLFWGYTAPDAATACIIYLSVFWSIILSFFSNLVFLIFFIDLTPMIFKYTSIFSILISIVFGIWKALQNHHEFVSPPNSKILLSLIFTSIGFLSIYLLHFYLYSFDLGDGYLIYMSLYGIIIPLLVIPIFTFQIVAFSSHLISAILLVFQRSKKYE